MAISLKYYYSFSHNFRSIASRNCIISSLCTTLRKIALPSHTILYRISVTCANMKLNKKRSNCCVSNSSDTQNLQIVLIYFTVILMFLCRPHSHIAGELLISPRPLWVNLQNLFAVINHQFLCASHFHENRLRFFARQAEITKPKDGCLVNEVGTKCINRSLRVLGLLLRLQLVFWLYLVRLGLVLWLKLVLGR